MTPKEKAILLHTLMYGDIGNGITWDRAKQCAIIAVDEILNSPKDGYVHFQDVIEYWEEVKSEIEKLTII